MKINAFLQSINNGIKTNVAQSQKEKSTSETLLADYKSSPSNEVQSIFDKYQIKPTSETLKQVSSFMNQAKGTDAQKLETLDITLYKGIEPTRDNLMTIHQALTHDSEVVKTLVDTPVPDDEPIKGAEAIKVIASLDLPPQVKAALRKFVDNGSTFKEAVLEVARMIKEHVPGAAITLDSKALNKILVELKAFIAENPTLSDKIFPKGKPEIAAQVPTKEFVGYEPVIQTSQTSQTIQSAQTKQSAQVAQNAQATQTVQVAQTTQTGQSDNVAILLATDEKNWGNANQSNSLKNDSFIEALPQGVARDASDAVQNNASGRVSEPPKGDPAVATDSEAHIENQDSESLDLESLDLSKLIEQMTESLLENADEMLGRIMEVMDLKTYLVETTTEATLQAKTTFENFRAETVKLLQTAQEPQNIAALTANLSKAIEKLNHIILKSNVTLYTDMLTEKKLLVMSSELEKAQNYVKQGELSKAQAIMKSATQLLQQINFNPSQRRLQVFAQSKMDQLQTALEKPDKSTVRLDALIKQHLESNNEVQGSRMARDVLETLRYLGLNHEMEVAESLEKAGFETQKDWNQSNVKEILLKLMKEDVKDRPIESAQQNLMNFSGQQMMNDSSTSEQPFYFFNMPILDGDELGNMKVYMKGASKNHQLDWQNTELYFGVTLKQTGALGIKVKIQQEKVDIQVLSDKVDGIEERLAVVMEELEEIGFSKGEISYKSYSKDTGIVLKPKLEGQRASVSTPTEGKGFDFKV